MFIGDVFALRGSSAALPVEVKDVLEILTVKSGDVYEERLNKRLNTSNCLGILFGFKDDH